MFVVQANDGNAVVPAIKQALKKGITVVGEFTPVGPNYATIQPQVPGLIFVGESPVANGHSLGHLGVEACAGINPCKVAYLQGFKSLPLDNARTAAVLQTLKSAKNVQVVASPEGGYTQASGLKAAQDVLSAHSDVNVIIGSSQAIEGTAAGGQASRQARQDQADRQRRILPGDQGRAGRHLVCQLHHRRALRRSEGNPARDRGREWR